MEPQPAAPQPGEEAAIVRFITEPLRLRLVIEGDGGVSARDLVDLLRVIDRVLREAEATALAHAAPYLEDLPGVQLPELRERILREELRSLRIVSTTTGSLIFEGALVALGYWLLKTTLGESVKEGYKASELHRRLGDISRRMFDVVSSSLAEIGAQLSLVLAGRAYRVVVRTEPDGAPGGVPAGGLIEVRVPPEAQRAVDPTYGQVTGAIAA